MSSIRVVRNLWVKKLLISSSLLAASGIAIYLIEPYYCVWNRRHIEASFSNCETPSVVNNWARDICKQFGIPNERADQLDIFCGNFEQALSFGSLRRPGYAFIALPDICKYKDVSEVPLDKITSRNLIPFSPFSPMGTKVLESLVLSEEAIKFLIAREIARLWGAGPRLSDCPNPSGNETPLLNEAPEKLDIGLMTTRNVFLVTCWSLIASIYIGYQAWRRHRCFKVDQVADQVVQYLQHNDVKRASTGIRHPERKTNVSPGVEYYRWRLEWNQMFIAIQALRLQAQTNAKDAYEPGQSMPSIIEMTQASRGEPYTWNGSERWMADGDCHSPSAGELLANRSWLIRSLAGVLFAPATSLNRLKALDTRST